jgi:hypothetical protein
MSEPVKKIRIRLKGATVHLRGPLDTRRVETISGCAVPVGNAHVIEVKPGTPFEIEEAAGLRLLKIHSGEIVEEVEP